MCNWIGIPIAIFKEAYQIMKPVVNHETALFGSPHPNGYSTDGDRIERAWAHWKKIGEPKLIVAPMVNSSELPFRLLCRKYGAEAAYTPMLYSRIFAENEKYRSQEFTTCKVTMLCTYAYITQLVLY